MKIKKLKLLKIVLAVIGICFIVYCGIICVACYVERRRMETRLEQQYEETKELRKQVDSNKEN